MPPDPGRRGIIPLHGDEATGRSPASGTANLLPDIVAQCPAALRPAAVEILALLQPDDSTLAEERRRLAEYHPNEIDAGQVAAVVSILRAEAGSRAEHELLDGAVAEWHSRILRRRDEVHRRFMRDVSHDIRSPLNSILFLADALRSGHSGELNEVQARQMDVLFMASVTLVKLVNDLIDFAHLDGRAEIHVSASPFSPGAVVEEIRNLVGPLLDYHRVAFEVSQRAASPRQGDGQLLNRIILNLVTNAVQATPEGGAVQLLTEDDPETGGLIVRLKDAGPGIDLDAVRDLLDTAAEGTVVPRTRTWTHGLGLSIAARLAHAAGGTLTVDGLEPSGTEFCLLLPFGAL